MNNLKTLFILLFFAGSINTMQPDASSISSIKKTPGIFAGILKRKKRKKLTKQLINAVQLRDEQAVIDLIATGANVNVSYKYREHPYPNGAVMVKNVHKMTLLNDSTTYIAYGLNINICKLLLQAGAQVNARPALSFSDLADIVNCFSLDIASDVIFAPNPEMIAKSQDIIMAFLLCLKRVAPKMPRDVRYLLLSALPSNDLGICMIARKLQGKSIPLRFMQYAGEALYQCSLAEFKHVWPKAIDYAFDLKRIKHEGITSETIDEWAMSPGNSWRTNIIDRLSRAQLNYNGVVGETDLKNKSVK
jgi:hypothetical protein